MKRLRTQTAFAALAILAILATESATAMPQNIAISSDGEPSVIIPVERMYAVALPSEVLSDIKSLRKISTPITATPSERLVVAKEIDLPTEDSEVEKLAKLIPETIDEAEANIAPQRNRFLMWTHDLKHVMWGYYRNGFFVGKDNHGVRAWGVCGNGYFAGLYNGEFFWGRYRAGHWKAKNLFGEQDTTHGGYVLAPTLVAVRNAETVENKADYSVLSSALATPATATRNYDESQISVSTRIPDEVDELKKRVPIRPEEAEEAMRPLKGRFLMWTHDLKHIMWGCFGNGYFVGADNLGERAWGIYGEKVFAGLYDGDFFWGFYGSGRWRAFGLFGERRTYGRYLTAKNS